MRRISFGLGLATMMVGTLIAAQEAKKADSPKTGAVSGKALMAQADKEMATLRSSAANAKDEGERKQNYDKWKEKASEYLGKFTKAIEEDPKSDDAVDVAAFCLTKLLGSKADHDKLMKSVDENLLDHPKVGVLVLIEGSDNPKFLEKVEAKNKLPHVQALVKFKKASNAFELYEYRNTSKAEDGEAVLKLLAELPKDIQPVNTPYGIINIKKKIEEIEYAVNNLGIGRTMADLVSKDLDGKPVKLSDYKGKVVVIDVWHTQCGPCVAMIPHERKLVEKLKDKPFALISISADPSIEILRKFLEVEENKMPWVHWFTGWDGELSRKLNVRFYPTIYVLDAKGVIRYKHVRGEKMDEAVETLLKEVEGK